MPLVTANKKYVVHSVFLTIQGEGEHTGKRSVFVRFSGCNVWDGQEKNRKRDAERNSRCALWCDTEFYGCDENNGGGSYDAQSLVNFVVEMWGARHTAGEHVRVVFTGGEPSLQLDDALVFAFSKRDCHLAVETNGTKELPKGLDWVTLSPKPPMSVVRQRYDEVKVLYPLYDPIIWEEHADLRWVQPLDYEPKGQALSSLECIDFVLKNPRWNLSHQLHKAIGLP
jgi:organic radical activating enzyme